MKTLNNLRTLAARHAVPVRFRQFASIVAIIAFTCQPIAASCNAFFVKRQKAVVVQKKLVPVAVAAPIYYGVGHQIQQQAINQKQIEAIVHAAVSAALQHASVTDSAGNLPSVTPQFQSQTAIQKHCGSCHGTTPKGNQLSLTDGSLSCQTITESLRQIRDGHMPKNGQLTPEQKGAVMDELLNREASEVPPEPKP